MLLKGIPCRRWGAEECETNFRKKHRLSFRELYRLMDGSGRKSAEGVVHGKLDAAVRGAYGMTKGR